MLRPFWALRVALRDDSASKHPMEYSITVLHIFIITLPFYESYAFMPHFIDMHKLDKKLL